MAGHLEILAIDRAAGKAPTSDLAKALDSLGILRWRQGKLEEAESAYREGLAVARNLGKDDGPRLVEGIYAFSQKLINHGRLAEAEDLLQEAMPIEIALRYREGWLLRLLASVLRQRGKPGEVKKIYRNWLQELRTRVPIDIPALANALASFALDRISEQQFVAAEELARECLALREH
jgi:tetratricopeptide (TPR) repeat protein